MARTTEPKMTALAEINRIVRASPRKITPPAAAITGTDSWTRAVRVTVRDFNAAYQAVKPRRDASTPDAVGRGTPLNDSESHGHVNTAAGKIKSAARWKFPAVTEPGSPAALPLME